jgi:ribonuclease HI
MEYPFLTIYTDGGCHGNPGPGAWAFVISGEDGHALLEKTGREADTTNNRMELTAVIEALRAGRELLLKGGKLSVYTDSRYVKNGITDWIRRWKVNGWLSSGKKPVKNRELWETLDKLAGELAPEWRWVRGHNGNPLNERCDSLVQKAIDVCPDRGAGQSRPALRAARTADSELPLCQW